MFKSNLVASYIARWTIIGKKKLQVSVQPTFYSVTKDRLSKSAAREISLAVHAVYFCIFEIKYFGRSRTLLTP